MGYYYSSMVGLPNADAYDIQIIYATITGVSNTEDGSLTMPKIRKQHKLGISFQCSDASVVGCEVSLQVMLSAK